LKKLIKKLYSFCRKCRLIRVPLKMIYRLFKKAFPKLGRSVGKLIYEQRIEENRVMVNSGQLTKEWIGEVRIPFKENPLVSVIVPNYNHAAYLRERLDSIYNQSYTNFEVILLDDCSSDNSREILMEYAEKYPEKTVVDFNEQNGGKVFKQWNKGINYANGKLIWIAESDDWCELDFLEKMVPQFELESVMLAYCNSVFMQEGQKIWDLEGYYWDLPSLCPGKPFTISANTAVNAGFAIKNLIPNVSSAMFRNVGEIPQSITDIWQNIKLCGDWLFYLHTMRGGTLSYTNETTNYYRIHKKSTSLKVQKTMEYYQEYESISKYIVQNFKVDMQLFERVLQILEQHYVDVNDNKDVAIVSKYYNLDNIRNAAKNRKHSVLMCCYSLQMGGGETYPIFLANEMRRQGINVTLLNFNMGEYLEEVRVLLNPDVPLINIDKTENLGNILFQIDADIAHSHHASIDQLISTWLRGLNLDCKQVVSLHGMYEAIDKEISLNIFEELKDTCSQLVYTADKNLARLEELGYADQFSLSKIGNALPVKAIHLIDREELSIGAEDFVLCLVSRAIADKGWQEAVDAVLKANAIGKRKIHLLLIGDGPMKKRLEQINSQYVHLLGQKSNIRDYFAMADMGFLPSAFKGESFPLVVIDCLMSGRPVLASDIGEIRHQLTDETGAIAGKLFSLNNWKIDTQKLAEQIVDLAENPQIYDEMKKNVASAVKKFDISLIVKQYVDVYERAIDVQKRKE